MWETLEWGRSIWEIWTHEKFRTFETFDHSKNIFIFYFGPQNMNVDTPIVPLSVILTDVYSPIWGLYKNDLDLLCYIYNVSLMFLIDFFVLNSAWKV